MNRSLIWLLSVLQSVFLLATLKTSAQTWSLKKDQDSIKVYSAHSPDSKFKRIRAEFTLRSSREKLFQKLIDADRYVDWQYNTLKSKTIQKISPREILYYNEVDAPWPVSNRDLVIRLKIIEEPGQPDFRILTWSEPTALPAIEDIVRVPNSKGEWRVNELPDGRLKVTFEMQIDPGGDVPAWLVNMVSALAPYQTFFNLKKMLE